jgi:ferrochelatase
MKKTAVILFNLGGPDKPGSVRKFLFNLFNDKAIIGLIQPFRFLLANFISLKRAKTAREIYSYIGGKSPILEITNAQGEALEKELSFIGNYKVFTIMRYWHPMAKEVMEKIKEYDPSEVILLPLYPQFSTTTSNSSFEDFYRSFKEQKMKAKIKYVCCYPTNSHFINSHLRIIKEAIAKTTKAGPKTGFKDFRLLFSAHGLPQKIIDAGDPYCFQVQQTTEAIVKELPENIDYKICYQSKVGPLEWTKPSLEFEINRAGLDGRAVIIIPIAFVSDHSETLVELDIEYKEMAKNKKIPFYLRVPALNSDGYFIKALLDICKRTSEADSNCNGGDFGTRICPKNFKKCINSNY